MKEKARPIRRPGLGGEGQVMVDHPLTRLCDSLLAKGRDYVKLSLGPLHLATGLYRT